MDEDGPSRRPPPLRSARDGPPESAWRSGKDSTKRDEPLRRTDDRTGDDRRGAPPPREKCFYGKWS
ncbi:hypothetical protein NQ318_001608 [Aromia moschata]|uniref:Uncharacterized protein n=1 Tax=Aromia moschata TaxID=1265417 RepID=A0AAV8Y219_9CUCU|nr:hypothetical protein NQ318_001608 [Aromia moschata]